MYHHKHVVVSFLDVAKFMFFMSHNSIDQFGRFLFEGLFERRTQLFQIRRAFLYNFL